MSESALAYHERYAGYSGQELLECQHKLISEDLSHHCSCVSKAGHGRPDLWERMQRIITAKAHYLPAQTGTGAAESSCQSPPQSPRYFPGRRRHAQGKTHPRFASNQRLIVNSSSSTLGTMWPPGFHGSWAYKARHPIKQRDLPWHSTRSCFHGH